MYIISLGNTFDGLTLYGPFQDHEAALEYIEKNCPDLEWNLVQLNSPEAEEPTCGQETESKEA